MDFVIGLSFCFWQILIDNLKKNKVKPIRKRRTTNDQDSAREQKGIEPLINTSYSAKGEKI